jgi:hypothetical protein
MSLDDAGSGSEVQPLLTKSPTPANKALWCSMVEDREYGAHFQGSLPGRIPKIITASYTDVPSYLGRLHVVI